MCNRRATLNPPSGTFKSLNSKTPFFEPLLSGSFRASFPYHTVICLSLAALCLQVEDTQMIIELLDGSDPIDASLLEEARANLAWFNRAMDKYELDRLLSGPYDQRGARLTITAGAGGTDAQVREGLQQHTGNKLDSFFLILPKLAAMKAIQRRELSSLTECAKLELSFQISSAVVWSRLLFALLYKPGFGC